MNRKVFLNKIDENIEDATIDELKSIIVEISKDIPEGFYFKTLCRIKNLMNNDIVLIDELGEKIKNIYIDFKKVQDGEIVFKCYELDTGTYSPVGEIFDYCYYPTNEMNNLLNRMYNLICKLIFSKNYKEALNIIDLMLYSDYSCEEIPNPVYSDDDEVIDIFDMDIDSIKENLGFDINIVVLYAVYAILMIDMEDKFEKIDYYTKGKYIDIRDCQNLGIEKISNFDIIYDEWLKYKNT